MTVQASFGRNAAGRHSSPRASLGWFARHEARLAWRDMALMLQGGRRGRAVWAVVAVIVFEAVLHLLAYGMLEPSRALLSAPDKGLLVALTGSAVLAWMLLLSQAMESVTRSFYARADLDLILSSPAPSRYLFAIRILANAVGTVVMAVLLIGPVIDVAAVFAGPRLLFGYGMLVSLGVSALAVAVGVTVAMFRVFGPKRTRLLAQVVAGVVGAGFVVLIQGVAILSYGGLSRTALFRSPTVIAAAPDPASALWWPARAALGDAAALAACLVGALAVLAAATLVCSTAFAANAARVAGMAETAVVGRGKATFVGRSRGQGLRMKEWTLLWRDPWLVSQSLMQVLYLAPPALLLWRDYGSDGEGLVVLVPVLVMAAGQLAGGLAWLAFSGEDAPDLVATAPIAGAAVLRAKIEAVMVAVALPLAPLVVAMAFVAPRAAALTLVGSGLAAAGASAVQLLFRSQAKRSGFRRRQTSSRLATFAEAFLSIAVAAAAGLAATGLWLLMLAPLAVAVLVLVAARAVAGSTR